MMDLYQKCIEKALKLITKKRYTSSEIEKKIRNFVGKLERLNKGLSFTVEEVNCVVVKVINRLQELGYVDDEKFAQDYVKDRVRFKPRGKFLIRQELAKKGLNKEQVHELVESVDELPMTLALIEKKSRRWTKEPIHKQKEKAFRFLASKGFGPDAIYKAIKSHYNLSS